MIRGLEQVDIRSMKNADTELNDWNRHPLKHKNNFKNLQNKTINFNTQSLLFTKQKEIFSKI